MKTTLLSLATALLLSSTSFAAPALPQDGPAQDAARRNGHRNDRRDKDFNYGYDKTHKVTAEEKARWETTHKNDRRDDNRQATPEDKARWEARKNSGKGDRKDDRKDFNYGYDKDHKVTAEEKARWEAAHKNDRRNDNRQDDRR